MNTASSSAPQEANPDLPPGFDPKSYLLMNPDVADVPDLDPAYHYCNYGKYEVRSLFAEGHMLDHPRSRALDPAARADWLTAIRGPGAPAIMDRLAAHPRMAWLETGFVLGGYLERYPEIAAAVDDPLEAAFHFLEFGLEDGLLALPGDWDSDFLLARYGIEIPESWDELQRVLARMFATGMSPLDIALTEGQFWERAGFHGESLSRFFDHEYYHAMVTRAVTAAAEAVEDLAFPPLTSHDRMACIDHFIAHGITAGLGISAAQAFDPAFYCDELGKTAARKLLNQYSLDPAAPIALDDADREVLYRHWLQKGLRKGVPANLSHLAKAHFNVTLPEALAAQLPIYRLAANMPADTTDGATLRHLLSTPRPALAALDLTAVGVQELVRTLADRAAISANPDDGEWLYRLTLIANPANLKALQHLADLQQRRGHGEEALLLREKVPHEHGGGWNTLARAEALLNSQKFEVACAELAALPAKFMGDVAIAAKRWDLARAIFHRIWGNLGRHVAAYGIPRTQSQLRLALRLCTPEFTSVDRSRPVRHVALIGNEDLYQCKLYRVDQKAEQLRAAGYTVTILSPSRDLGMFQSRLDEFDAVIFFRVPAFPPMIDAMVAAARQGVKTFYEIDDIVFDTDHFPPDLASYANQITEAQYAAMACGVPLFEHAMTLCDYGISSTATISRLMEKKVRTGRVFEHHNALGHLHLSAYRVSQHEEKPDGPLWIFYGSGTRAHKEDFHDTLEPALAEILRRHPGKVRVRLVGYFDKFKHLNPKVDPVELRDPVWDFDAFCHLVSQADINLSVLSPSMLTDAKSEIKWMEAGMFGIPSVVSATATHREVIEDGKTGFLCHTTEDFITHIDALVTDADLRRRVGKAAQEKVLKTYSLEAMGENLRSIFASLEPAGPPKKRIAIVNVFYPPQAIGGATRVVHDNVTLLREHYGDKYEIDVICTVEGGRNPLELNVYSEGGVRVWAITAPQQADGDMTPRDPRMAEVFERVLERISPDLVHFHCIQRLTATVVDCVRRREIPYLITLHDGWWISPNQFIINDRDKPAFYDFAQHDAPDFPDRAQAFVRPLKWANRLLSVSESFAEIYRNCGLANVSVVENGVSEIPEHHRTQSASGRVRLAHIGGASRHKGIHLVRNALLANAYENLELLLIDHALPPGTTRHEVWGTTPVTLASKVSQSEIGTLYSNIDILLAPSIWPESYGLVTREAAACGAWVIASDRGAIGADIEEGVNGHRIDVSSYAGLAAALWTVDRAPDTYLQSPLLAPAIRPVRAQVDELAQVYDEVLAGVVKT